MKNAPMTYGDHILLASDKLFEAKAVIDLNLYALAASQAYYAASHAAAAYIIAHTGQSAGSHDKVRSQFFLLTKDNSKVPPGMRKLLGKAYKYAEVADHGLKSQRDKVTFKVAAAAIFEAGKFLETVATLTAAKRSPRLVKS